MSDEDFSSIQNELLLIVKTNKKKMTPYYIEDLRSYYLPPPMIEVEQEIVRYCDYFTVDAKRTSLRYKDCVWMHLGFYGNNSDTMKKVRMNWSQSIKPIFK